MRYSQYLLPTLKETPGDAEVVSHQLMLRSGMIRKIAAGIYDYLPLGLRVIRKVEAIVREEMNRAGAIELLMPMVVPADLWEESGRWQQYGRELLRFKDRKETDFCLGPTHEEVITEIVRGTLRSYKQLPINLYQIQSKFRDEIRPRFGLMRGREFIMKDAYSFDLTDSDADEAYDRMYQAYRRIFQRCGLKFRAVEADTGNIGGTSSHEFMVLADSGEDAIVSCAICDYAANVEKAELRPPASSEKQTASLKAVVTPNRKTIEEVSAFLNVASQRTVKTLIVQTDTGEVVAVLLRGDRELNTIKLCHVLACEWVELAPEEKIKKITGAPSGFSGPVDLPLKIFADLEVEGMSDFVVGANQIDTHYTGANHGRDFSVAQFADLRQAESGDFCPRCDGTLEVWRGIEVGHVFKLGTKYSEAMNATVLDEKGQERTLVMGCYGIGVGRTAAAAIEQNHDEFGIIWPMPLAPFQLIISIINPNDQTVLEAGRKLYQELLKQGIEVLFDDRDERPGSKFKDADLIGIPLRVNVGARALKEQSYELQDRRSGDRKMLPMHEAAEQLIKMIDDAMNVTAE
ncbi:MAG: proline--tRNA ligase [Deltaproteobacteria bacterium]|jgi:prolyl-tRNA synthetase|nr:proline--tRNA ligase [Deltaproteobacteria bacterium]